MRLYITLTKSKLYFLRGNILSDHCELCNIFSVPLCNFSVSYHSVVQSGNAATCSSVLFLMVHIQIVYRRYMVVLRACSMMECVIFCTAARVADSGNASRKFFPSSRLCVSCGSRGTHPVDKIGAEFVKSFPYKI